MSELQRRLDNDFYPIQLIVAFCINFLFIYGEKEIYKRDDDIYKKLIDPIIDLVDYPEAFESLSGKITTKSIYAMYKLILRFFYPMASFPHIGKWDLHRSIDQLLKWDFISETTLIDEKTGEEAKYYNPCTYEDVNIPTLHYIVMEHLYLRSQSHHSNLAISHELFTIIDDQLTWLENDVLFL